MRVEGRISSRDRYRYFAFYEAWNLGIVAQPLVDIVRHGIRGRVRWFPPLPPQTMLADPACRVMPDGGLTIYAEYLDYRRPRGEIWSAEVRPGADPIAARFRPLLVQDFHMSYPFPFEGDDGAQLMTAETWQAGRALLWHESDGSWQAAGDLLPDMKVVDPTLLRMPDRWWLFCTLEDNSADERLYLFHTERLGTPWTPHRRNPVKTDRSSSRPAGPIFKVDDVWIRPAQDCSNTYGGATVLHAIRRLDLDGYEEEPVRRLEPLSGPYPHGLHTICAAGDGHTLIDAKRWRFDPPRVARRLHERAIRWTRPQGAARNA